MTNEKLNENGFLLKIDAMDDLLARGRLLHAQAVRAALTKLNGTLKSLSRWPAYRWKKHQALRNA